MGNFSTRIISRIESDTNGYIWWYCIYVRSIEISIPSGNSGNGSQCWIFNLDKEVVWMSRGFLFKTILIYEALAIVGWNIMARTEADYEKWLFENIHAVVYITLSSTMLFVTMVYVIQWSLDKLGLRRKMAELQDPRRTDEEKKKIKTQ